MKEKELYNNKRFRITQSETGAIYIESGYYATSATTYHDNTVGYDNPGILNKAIRRAINNIVTRQTGKPALVNINVMNEKKTYREYFQL